MGHHPQPNRLAAWLIPPTTFWIGWNGRRNSAPLWNSPQPKPDSCPLLSRRTTGGSLIWQDVEFLKLAALKLADETNTGWLSKARIEAFRRSIEPELRPVLRPDAFDSFDFDAALATMVAVAEALNPHLATA